MPAQRPPPPTRTSSVLGMRHVWILWAILLGTYAWRVGQEGRWGAHYLSGILNSPHDSVWQAAVRWLLWLGAGGLVAHALQHSGETCLAWAFTLVWVLVIVTGIELEPLFDVSEPPWFHTAHQALTFVFGFVVVSYFARVRYCRTFCAWMAFGSLLFVLFVLRASQAVALGDELFIASEYLLFGHFITALFVWQPRRLPITSEDGPARSREVPNPTAVAPPPATNRERALTRSRR